MKVLKKMEMMASLRNIWLLHTFSLSWVEDSIENMYTSAGVKRFTGGEEVRKTVGNKITGLCCWLCHWCSERILTSSLVYYWTDPWQCSLYVFFIKIIIILLFKGDIYTSVLQYIMNKNQSYMCNTTDHVMKTYLHWGTGQPFVRYWLIN